jgi:hypothetical protein
MLRLSHVPSRFELCFAHLHPADNLFHYESRGPDVTWLMNGRRNLGDSGAARLRRTIWCNGRAGDGGEAMTLRVVVWEYSATLVCSADMGQTSATPTLD